MDMEHAIHEYTPGEYCKSVGCKFYRSGAFSDECDSCRAYVFFLWLQENEYRILKLTASCTGAQTPADQRRRDLRDVGIK